MMANLFVVPWQIIFFGPWQIPFFLNFHDGKFSFSTMAFLFFNMENCTIIPWQFFSFPLLFPMANLLLVPWQFHFL